MISSRDEKPGPWNCTVMPRLELRTGLSTRSPLTGLIKHQAGTTPSSILLSDVASCLKSDFGTSGRDVLRSFPTRHHPSSNDCMIVSCSPGVEISNSSGSTGLNNCRTLRLVPIVWPCVLFEPHEDTEKRFCPLAVLKNESRNREIRLALCSGMLEVAAIANENGFGMFSACCLNASSSTCSPCRRIAFSGTVIEESMRLREKFVSETACGPLT